MFFFGTNRKTRIKSTQQNLNLWAPTQITSQLYHISFAHELCFNLSTGFSLTITYSVISRSTRTPRYNWKLQIASYLMVQCMVLLIITIQKLVPHSHEGIREMDLAAWRIYSVILIQTVPRCFLTYRLQKYHALFPWMPHAQCLMKGVPSDGRLNGAQFTNTVILQTAV